jgi:hypothetical protein
MHTAKSLKEKKNHSIFSYNKNKNSKTCSSMHFDFNNQFIKAMRTRQIFQKKPKNYFVLF